tara:strand:- start:19 stop:267 length:249 start_codon:yes stop_codon:yes gene_type:complete
LRLYQGPLKGFGLVSLTKIPITQNKAFPLHYLVLFFPEYEGHIGAKKSSGMNSLKEEKLKGVWVSIVLSFSSLLLSENINKN